MPVNINAWVIALEQSPSIQNRDLFQEILSELPASIRGSVNRNLPNLRAQLRSLVRTCQNHSNGLIELVDAVATYDGETAVSVQQLRQLLQAVPPAVPSRSETNVPSPLDNKLSLRDKILQYFNVGELRDMCMALSFDYDDLGGEGRSNKVRELVLYMERHGRTQELIYYCQQTRPRVDWTE